jgi:formate dehydrogenase subunit gamma
MARQEIEKYRRPVRILHWVHTGAFIVLFLTGIMFFIPALSFLAIGGWTRLVHRAAAMVFVIAPLVYLVFDPASALRGLKMAFTWSEADFGWFRAAPRYYLLGDEKAMPPQGFLNSGQKIWWLLTLVFGVVVVVTGLVMWLGVKYAPTTLLKWAVSIHDIAFIVTGAMFFVHVYLGAFHPKMTEAWRSMAGGRISEEYARLHHGRWYEEVTGKREEKKS